MPWCVDGQNNPGRQSRLRSGLTQGLLFPAGYQAHKIMEFPCLHSSHLTISTESTDVHYHTQPHTWEGAEPRPPHLHRKCLSQGLISAALRVVAQGVRKS